jgi:hypothetical protein
MHTHGNPVFTLSYHLVDYCYNVTFVARNGSFELKPTGELQCTFKIYLPYGNRVALNLQIGDSTSTGEHSADEVTRNWNISRRAFVSQLCLICRAFRYESELKLKNLIFTTFIIFINCLNNFLTFSSRANM